MQYLPTSLTFTAIPTSEHSPRLLGTRSELERICHTSNTQTSVLSWLVCEACQKMTSSRIDMLHEATMPLITEWERSCVRRSDDDAI